MAWRVSTRIDDGTKTKYVNFEPSSWQEIEREIDALDGNTHSEVTIYPDSSEEYRFMCVCGGRGGMVVVNYCTSWDSEQPFLVDESVADGDVVQKTGGQEVLLPAKINISRDMAKSVVRHYYKSREVKTNLSWISEF